MRTWDFVVYHHLAGDGKAHEADDVRVRPRFQLTPPVAEWGEGGHDQEGALRPCFDAAVLKQQDAAHLLTTGRQGAVSVSAWALSV
jgi:hypothetical protein